MPDFSAIRQRLADQNPDPRSLARNPTSLSTFITIYQAAWKQCYPEYMKGAAALAEWLAPIALPAIPPSYKVPKICISYEVHQLAKILAPAIAGRYDISKQAEWHRALVYTATMNSLESLGSLKDI